MAKYIDAEKLKAEIERYKQGAAIARFANDGENADYFQGKVDLCDDLTHIIASLQQDRPKQEWGEEDKKFFDNALSGLKYAYEDLINHKSFDSAEDVKNAFDWLKSLRPQPKQEWSEEDERNRDRAIFYTRDYQQTNGTTDGSEKCIDWLKSLRPQPKQEWSEEDEKKRRNLMSLLADMRGDRITEETYQKYYPWLKSLRPQPKAELTLLDENIINAAIAFVEQNDHFNCWRGIDKHTVIKALRSLKPHWKPSEDQMSFLLRLEGELRVGNHTVAARNLAELYNDLQML